MCAITFQPASSILPQSPARLQTTFVPNNSCGHSALVVRAVGCQKCARQKLEFTSQIITESIATEFYEISTQDRRVVYKLEMEDGGAEGGNWDGLLPEVLDMIFQHLPVQDLLSCSIVSKNWKKAARDVLKRSRECYAYIKYIPQDLQDLNEMIVSTDIIEMINGLHIRNEVRPNDNIRMDMSLWQRSKRASSFWRRHTSCSDVARILQSGEAREKLDEAKQKILGVLCSPWRYLDLRMGLDVSIDKGLLLREVILSTSGSLQKLVIGNREDWKFIPCCDKSFEKLEVIQAQKEQDLRALTWLRANKIRARRLE